MTTPPDPALLTSTNESLATLLPILNGFAHRHKNQHSSSHWWSSFSLLRRAARNLADDLASRTPTASKTKSGDAKRDNHPALARAKWMKRHVVPRAFVTFSQLAADNQHAPLGLLLLSVLARINTLLSHLVPAEYSHETSTPAIAKPEYSQTDLPSAPHTSATGVEASSSGVDMGVAISRDELVSSRKTKMKPLLKSEMRLKEATSKERKPRVLHTDTHKSSLKEDTKDRPKKKKKKGGDALSSLFGSL
ncbi:RNase MRP subunit [Fusarium torreyae]|uniref:RNase MRP subunit n=1 Tax=Fusarium torreyae TaxID=1237075 RepID=A0A9W8VGV3_9HYPO|nr:RNase MRP subunit [Fusarium torreyae]